MDILTVSYGNCYLFNVKSLLKYVFLKQDVTLSASGHQSLLTQLLMKLACRASSAKQEAEEKQTGELTSPFHHYIPQIVPCPIC